MRFHRIMSLVVVALLATAVPFALPSASAAEIAMSGVVGSGLRSVRFLNATTGFAAADNGVIVKTTDGGESWTEVRAADTYSFRGIDFRDDNNGVAVDYSGKAAQTTNGGTTWTNVNFSPFADMDGEEVNSRSHHDVAYWPGSTIAITAAGTLSPGQTDAGGATSMRTTGALEFWLNPLTVTEPHMWYNSGSLEYEPVGTGEFLDVEYVSSSVVWASGIDYWATFDGQNAERYPLFKSIDGGSSYTKVPGFGQTHLRFEGVAFGSASAGAVVGQVVGGNRSVYYTTNGGTTWTTATFPASTAKLNAVDMSSAANGWAVGEDGGIIRTTNGGATWTACTITGGNSFPLYDVQFLSGTTTGWAVGGAGTVLLTTDGATWRAPSAPDNTAPTTTPSVDRPAPNGADGWYLFGTGDGSSVPQITLTANETASTYYHWDAEAPTLYGGAIPMRPGVHTLTYWSVDAADNEEAPHKTVSYKYDPSGPTAPSGLTVQALSSTSVRLSWDASVDSYSGVKNYVLDRKLPAPYTTLTQTVGTQTTIDLSGLASGTAYTFVVYGKDVAGWGGSASEVSITTAGTPPTPAPKITVYRLYNKVKDTHFYTASETEMNYVLATWPTTFRYDGPAYNADPATDTLTLHRLYNLQTGTHFYTASDTEKNYVLTTWPTTFRYDGPAFSVSLAYTPGKTLVHRLYNLKTGTHFYTASDTEKNYVLANWPTTFRYDGPAYSVGP